LRFFDVSSGGNSPKQEIISGPSYQTGFASHIKNKVGVPTIAVGQINEPLQAESIISTGQADMIAIGRGMLYNPRWAWHAAEVFKKRMCLSTPNMLEPTIHLLDFQYQVIHNQSKIS